MTTSITFSRQNDAGSNAIEQYSVLGKSRSRRLVVILVSDSKALYYHKQNVLAKKVFGELLSFPGLSFQLLFFYNR